MIENRDVLDEVEVEEEAVLLGPGLAELVQKDSLSAVEVKPVDRVDAVLRLVHETRDSDFLEVAPQDGEHAGVVGTHDHLLRAVLLLLDDLLQDVDLAADELLLHAAFEFFL